MYIDEETQEFVWYYSSFNEIPRAIQLLDILKKNEWLHNDKVIISKQDVVNYLKYMGWENVDINTTFLFLFSLKNREQSQRKAKFSLKISRSAS